MTDDILKEWGRTRTSRQRRSIVLLNRHGERLREITWPEWEQLRLSQPGRVFKEGLTIGVLFTVLSVN